MSEVFNIKTPNGSNLPFIIFNDTFLMFGYSDGFPDEWGIDVCKGRHRIISYNSVGTGRKGLKEYQTIGHVVASKFNGGKALIAAINADPNIAKLNGDAQ